MLSPWFIYFRDVAINIPAVSWYPYLQCVSSDSTLSGGEWSRFNKGPIDCTNNTDSDPLSCITTNTPANLTLYKPDGPPFPPSENQLYKYCLPTSCSNPTYIITAYIFGKLY